LCPGEWAEVWLDADGFEAGFGGVYSEDGREEVIIGTCAPGVAIGAGGLRGFGKGGEIYFEHIAPRPEHFDIAVGETDFIHCSYQIEAEIERALGEVFL